MRAWLLAWQAKCSALWFSGAACSVSMDALTPLASPSQPPMKGPRGSTTALLALGIWFGTRWAPNVNDRVAGTPHLFLLPTSSCGWPHLSYPLMLCRHSRQVRKPEERMQCRDDGTESPALVAAEGEDVRDGRLLPNQSTPSWASAKCHTTMTWGLCGQVSQFVLPFTPILSF